MATRIIKLQNDSYTLLPVTDAKLVQMTVDGNTKSVYDVILEDEEVTAAGYNELNERLSTVEDTYITNSDVPVENKAAKLVVPANGTVSSAVTIATVKGTNITLTYSHGTPTGTTKNATKGTDGSQLAHNTGKVITGVNWKADANGHVTEISYVMSALPADTDTPSILSGEYRAASKTSYVKLTHNPGEVGFYDTGGKTGNTNDAVGYLTFSYTTGKGIGIKVSYTDRIQYLGEKVTSNVGYITLTNGGEAAIYNNSGTGLGKAGITFSYTSGKGIGIAITYQDRDTNTQTQKLSGEYRAASKTAYVKLSGDTNTEVGLYNNATSTAGTKFGYLEFAYTAGKGIGIKVSYTPAIEHEVVAQGNNAGIYPLLTYDIVTNLTTFNGGTHQVTKVLTPRVNGASPDEVPAAYIQNGKLYATDGFATRDVLIDGGTGNISGVGTLTAGNIISEDLLFKDGFGPLDYQEEGEAISLTSILDTMNFQMGSMTDENVKITGKNSNTNYPLVLRTNTSNISNGSTETTGLVTDTEPGSAYYNPSLNKLYSKNTYTDLLTVPTTSSATDTTKGINFYNGSSIAAHVGTSTILGLYSNGPIYVRPNGASSSVASNGSIEISNSGVNIYENVTAEKFIKSGGTSSQLLKANGDTISYTTTAPSSSSTNSTIPTSGAVWSAISPLSEAISTLQTTGIKLYGTTTKGPASNAAYTNGLTYIYSNGTNTYTIPAALSISGESEILESGDMFTYLESAKKWMVMDNNKDIATTQIAGTIKLYNAKRSSAVTTNSAASDSGRYYAIELDSNNKAFVNVPWKNDTTTLSGHYTPSGTTANATKGTDGSQLTHNSSMVMTGINWKADSKGHVTEISYTLAKLPADNNTDVKVNEWGKNNNAKYPVLFSYTTSDSSTTSASNNFVASDTDGSTNFNYNPSTNTLQATNITSTNVTATKHITSNGTASQLVTGTGTLQSISGLYAANMTIDTSANYIKEPEFKTVKINGSTTNAASTNNCVLQYDTTNKCLNFVFN